MSNTSDSAAEQPCWVCPRHSCEDCPVLEGLRQLDTDLIPGVGARWRHGSGAVGTQIGVVREDDSCFSYLYVVVQMDDAALGELKFLAPGKPNRGQWHLIASAPEGGE